MKAVYLLDEAQALEALDLCKAAIVAGEYGFRMKGVPVTYDMATLMRCLNTNYNTVCRLVENRSIREMAEGIVAE